MTITKFQITGMHCPSCKALIEDVAKDVSGVRSCTVDTVKQLGTVEHDGSLDAAQLIKEIEGVGNYKVTVL